MAIISHSGCVFLFIFLCVDSTIISVSTAQESSSSSLFVLGDSLFDSGNNNYLDCAPACGANFAPYGETFFKNATGRFSDGRIVPDFIAEYANLPLVPPYLQPGLKQYKNGVNFASGGSGVLNETNPNAAINLRTQLGYFEKVTEKLNQELGEIEAEKLLGRAVYLFSAGGNDYFQYKNSPEFQNQYVAMVVGNLTSVVEDVYKKGGRKFGFQDVGPLGCVPASRVTDKDCIKAISTMAELHNIALTEALMNLSNRLHGLKYSVLDYYKSLSNLMNSPTESGFKEGKAACCGSGPYNGYSSCGGKRGLEEYSLCSNPNEYVWFDFGHTTESANRKLAQLMWNGTIVTTGPYTVEELFQMQ